MGLSNFPTASDGILPVLVMNLLFTAALLRGLLKSAAGIMGGRSSGDESAEAESGGRRRRVSITQFKAICDDQPFPGGCEVAGESSAAECSVCLSRFEGEEEVSELSCRHYFHRSCLEKWFGYHRSSCPLCRSMH